MADEHNNHPVGSEPNVVHLKPEDVLQQLKEYMNKLPQVAYVISISPRNDPGNVSAYGNTGKSFAREMLRNLVHKLSTGRITIPFRA